jgi:alpha-beta hydrolase superfamily lysophospholipase
MPAEIDLSFLDDRSVLSVLFPLGYQGLSPFASAGGGAGRPLESSIEVEAGIRVGYALWVCDESGPTILHFHGNGEVVDDYEWIASVYAQIGVNLFSVDYRGYGGSDGTPTFTNVLRDASVVYQACVKILRERGLSRSLFVMGRSIGSIPACEVALRHQEGIRGLIIESGAANNFRYRWPRARPQHEDVLGDDGVFLNKVKLRQVSAPTLIIHGRMDDIVPFSEGEELYLNSAAPDKRLLAVPYAGHNDLLAIDPKGYFGAIRELIAQYR